MAIMDESLRNGYQPFSRQTFAPLQQPYQYGNSFSSKPSSAQPSDASPSMQAPGAGQAPPQRPNNFTPPSGPGAASNQGGFQNFAQMQAAGIARPAPPAMQVPPPSAPGQGGVPSATQSGPVGSALQQSILQALGNPSGFNAPQVQDAYKQLSQGIDDQYSQNTQKTNEEMARRGLYDSTEAAGRLHDLNIGQRDAHTALGQSLLTQQAQDFGQSRIAAIAQALGLTGQENNYTLGQNQNLLSLLGTLGGQGFYGDASAPGGAGAAGGANGVAAPGAAGYAVAPSTPPAGNPTAFNPALNGLNWLQPQQYGALY